MTKMGMSTAERMRSYEPTAIPSYLVTSGERRLEMDKAVRTSVERSRIQVGRDSRAYPVAAR